MQIAIGAWREAGDEIFHMVYQHKLRVPIKMKEPLCPAFPHFMAPPCPAWATNRPNNWSISATALAPTAKTSLAWR
jgi:hypothetical protein